MIPTNMDAEKLILQEGSSGQSTFQLLRDAVNACIQAGAFPPDTDLDLVSQTLWCTVHGLTANIIACPFFPWVDRDRLTDKTLDAVINGLRK